ncbi:hypothetical protein F441_14013 [Phytophthora nicotianae CJ01A1]|uniref:WRKY19-like zinc finger domain-containing protein n=6 Tax=Phytophthora nicotianae TaxID=4792 RepID=W2PXV3_PHYN3|nr:hypothetical protein PPTG_14784 [Phytophthora nicotianae INRA-310]ETI40537.1 hypothetical protein F443_14084 [Phytophthora nicotianae P1569]ETK80627.1 hypothetical protein L915_13731 [Phytophthora nicotianae]ETO69183.1 hypothetical protein F444_14115 [Phytophthora nicotianae P1976]ETP10302.1 hypothetical protein F441_14013 [Phytophthora nicotianae CJ01A1]ETP38445.1 hypothetical protein F442_13930 [Phytophthora nicotianae P10297]KUF84372.1 WRKY transcription factor 19 [Phytophthora nicotian
MSEAVEKQPGKQDAPALQPPTDSEGHPVREWIDTLLQAAVIAKDKQKKPVPGQDEASTTDVAADDTTITAAASEANAVVPAAETPSEAGKEVEDKTEATLVLDATDALGEDKAEAPTLDKAAPIPAAKRYRRRRCEVEGCTKFARFNNMCSGHGGRRLCGEAGCERVAQFGHKCSKHGGIKFCSIEGCRRAVQSRGCCKTHGGGVRCQHPDCTKGAISKGFCRSHGGGSRCAELNCQKWAQRHGYCVRHSKTINEVKPTPIQPDAELIGDATIPSLEPPPPINIST